jgi:hypothetical protein
MLGPVGCFVVVYFPLFLSPPSVSVFFGLSVLILVSFATLLVHLTQQIDNLTSKVGRTEAIVSNTIQEQVDDVKRGVDTRQISDKVPAAVIVSLWHKHNTGMLPVTFKYLTDLCGICFGKLDAEMKSDMGISHY